MERLDRPVLVERRRQGAQQVEYPDLQIASAPLQQGLEHLVDPRHQQAQEEVDEDQADDHTEEARVEHCPSPPRSRTPGLPATRGPTRSRTNGTSTTSPIRHRHAAGAVAIRRDFAQIEAREVSISPLPVCLSGDHIPKEGAMKYLLLIHQADSPTPRDPEAWATLSEDDQNAVYADYQAINQTAGVTPGLGLDTPETATTVRVQDGKTLVTDGPFVEIKEAVGGYFVFEADDLDAAIELAARVPAARLGGAVESVRPWSGNGSRPHLPRPVGPGPRCAHRLPRRRRPRRGSRAGGVRDRRGAVASRRRPCAPRRVADHDGAQPRHQSHPPRSHTRREDAAARGDGEGRGTDGRDDLPG